MEGNRRVPPLKREMMSTADDDEEDDLTKQLKLAIDDMVDSPRTPPPDDEQLEMLEDIWLKAGEMGKYNNV